MQRTNQLIDETSPYLLQHAHNPVDWHPWGKAAIELAQKQNKPIFLSVGYSACYWCHVMERQCFEVESVATELNSRFICIKVDREERPDVDSLYMTAVQLLTRHGGWPMNVWLTPELRPFFGGTYFPPQDSNGRPGLITIARGIEEAWNKRKDDIEKAATELTEALQRFAQPSAPDQPITIDDDWIHRLTEQSIADYDPHLGGFGDAPKFPRQTLLQLLLAQNQAKPSDRITHMITHTLDAMAMGGIRDQLGGGFHRYSTDSRWLVPHFEIMLYDNALLADIYLDAYRQTENRAYAQVARDILDFILRDMTSPEGAFYTAFDAEVDAHEGDPYLWTEAQIRDACNAGRSSTGGPPVSPSETKTIESGTDVPTPGNTGVPPVDFGEAEIIRFLNIYGLTQGPNFSDPHNGPAEPNQNILHIANPENPAKPLDVLFDKDLLAIRQTLLVARRQRKQPALDTKIITSWNALAIIAFAKAGRYLNEPRYLTAAARAAQFITTQHVDKQGELHRTSRDGVLRHRAFLDDYAFLCNALLALYKHGGDTDWRSAAHQWAGVMKLRFEDDDHGGFFFTESGATDMIVRQKTASDSPLPSGNAMAISALIQLDDLDPARKAIECFAQQIQTHPESSSAMIQATMRYTSKNGDLDIPAARISESKPLTPDQLAENVLQIHSGWESPTKLNVRLEIAPDYHINAHDASAGLLATQLAIHGDAAPEVDRIDYPPPTRVKLPFADEELRLYQDKTTIAIHFKTDQRGEGRILIALRYQPCTDTSCLPAMTQEVLINRP